MLPDGGVGRVSHNGDGYPHIGIAQCFIMAMN